MIGCNDNSKLIVLAGILNSKLPSFYIKQRYSASSYNTGVNFTKDMINSLPVPDYHSINLTPIYHLVRLISKSIDLVDNNVYLISKDVLDAFVFNLYFPDHMKERGIDVLEFVERDINEVMQGREFEKLSDTEKEQVIE